MSLNEVRKILPQSVKQPLRKLWDLGMDLKKVYLMKTAHVNPEPIVVLGHQKSGTTVIAALLGQLSGKEVTFDLFHQIDLSASRRRQLLLKELKLEEFIKKNKFFFSTPIIKDPDLTFLYPDIHKCLPEAKFIFTIRDPRDTIRSILDRLKLLGNLEQLEENDLETLRKMQTKFWYLIIHGLLPELGGDNYIEKLANRWNIAADIYIKYGENMDLLIYEDFVKNKVGTITNLAKCVGLKPVNDIANQVNIQYQPRGNNDISWLEFFGSDNLHRIETICIDRMKYFGYR